MAEKFFCLLNLLIVDDDEDLQNLLKLKLKKDFNVVSELSGTAALEKAISTEADIILLDLNMPNVDGFEVLSFLKLNPHTSQIPVLCFSGDKDENTRRRAQALGALGFIAKPVNTATLAKDILALMDALNVHLKSYDSKTFFHISLNTSFKKKFIDEVLYQEDLRKNFQVVLLSWTEGQKFGDEKFSKLIDDEELFYLQMKPSLITRFPYLQKLDPVVKDIRELIPQNPKPKLLIFDNPSLLINLNDPDSAMAKGYHLLQELNKYFDQIHFFEERPAIKTQDRLLQELAQKLTS